MDNPNQDHKEEIVVTPEEKQAEEEALKGVNDEELRSKLAEDFGIDPDIDTELLDKLVEKEKSHREKLSGAIKQKITWRDKAKGSQSKQTNNSDAGKTQQPEKQTLTTEDVDKLVNERLEARDLEELGLPDELKEEVKKLAKINGISVRQAARDPYISFKKEQIEKEKKIADAIPKRANRGSYTPQSYDPSKPLDPSQFDLKTAEGRKAWNDAKAARREYEAKHK